jgi:hypothetical protein
MHMSERKPISSIESVQISIAKTNPPRLQIDIDASYSAGGWSGPALNYRQYVTPPEDGIYEATLDADPPTDMASQAIVPFKHSETWANFPTEYLKGILIMSKSNSVKAVL